ncbi:nicotinate phosphoribosyltransferase [Acaryochloris sp. IP29b_bin.137]|uniref:nicotinate phosphoribosyltransferase n=1 Tax=Acaryochloris sp. IP29b_bin.137 TaxID=2969217 RepID=UPI002638077A|nr:nicotinate phosphoribosyltransferase [Acaryochloris sp. IP29b_bin.137]
MLGLVPPAEKSDLSLSFSASDYSLLTDLYQVTMSACYVNEKLAERPASFELTVRRMPSGYGYLIAMGLAQVLDYLQNLRFSGEQIEYLKQTDLLTAAPAHFWEMLAQGRFTGDVWAVPEGTAVFANEPFLRIEAPFWQAQWIETFLLNAINYQTLIATRAARLRDMAGPDATVLEFGTRRAFGPQASVWAARAALAAGLDATSNVLAAQKLGRQPSGTMAHALVMAMTATQGTELQAFTAFHRMFPKAALLIDTYDTIAAAQTLAHQVKAGELEVPAVRLDSGDLVELSQEIHQLLPDTQILVSGDLDELEIQRLRQASALIHGYGVGTKLVTGTPVNGVYKLVEIDGNPVMKEANGKLTYPGRKQIFRQSKQGQVVKDCLGLMDDASAMGQPLLQPVMKAGQRLVVPESLADIAQRTLAAVHSLPTTVRQVDDPSPMTVQLSTELEALTSATRRTAQKR